MKQSSLSLNSQAMHALYSFYLFFKYVLGHLSISLILRAGFRKEHISIRINDFGNLKITGERPLVGNRWSRFVKEFQVPDHCNASEIKAALENGLLRIELPNFAGGNRQDRKLRRRREMMAGKVVCARGPSRERRSPLEASPYQQASAFKHQQPPRARSPKLHKWKPNHLCVLSPSAFLPADGLNWESSTRCSSTSQAIILLLFSMHRFSFLIHELFFDTSPCSNSGLGFKKEDLKVQADTSGKLTVSGECAVEGNRWRRFLKTFQLPKDCNVREIEANLDKETLYVVLPKPADKMVKERGGGGVLRDPRKRKTLILSTVLVTVLVAGLGSYIASKLLR
ncbi:hypothetical protein ZIOFF_072238 [Zingiber officinale]|uniref:SHSP domain-containing protein n=1 Tax=Zingiber officinale TaxID=94328 RepID=A0A8J5EC22_ZINOF|nr:hypothetical protein ZIOFF_072238 [Zingiber officinale]